MTPSPPDALTINTIVTEILENIAFTSVQSREDGFPGWQDPALCWADVEMISPHTDHLTMALSQTLASQLAEDAWGGLSAEASSAAIHDFLGELSNILAGQLLARLYPGQEIILGLPTTGQGGHPTPPGRQFTFDVEGQPLCIALNNAA